jgi:hypothetical protein
MRSGHEKVLFSSFIDLSEVVVAEIFYWKFPPKLYALLHYLSPPQAQLESYARAYSGDDAQPNPLFRLQPTLAYALNVSGAAAVNALENRPYPRFKRTLMIYVRHPCGLLSFRSLCSTGVL